MAEYIEYKDSGIPWIGNIPAHWDIQRGKNILTLMDRPVKSDDEVITCFRDGEVTLRKNRREDGFTVSLQEIGYQGIEPGDLVVHGMDGFAGAIGVSDSRGKATPVLNVMDSSHNKRYLMYYLRMSAYKDVFMSLSTGIRVRSCDLRWNKLSVFPFVLPDRDEQDKIVDYIDDSVERIDSVIAEAKASIEEYKAWKASIIYEAVTKGLDPNVQMKDSGVEWIGEIPDTWCLRKIKNIASTGSGGTPKSDIREYYDGGINWVCSLDLHEQSISETKNTLSELGLQNCASEIRPIGTVVMAMYGGSGTIGSSGILRNPCATNQAICCIMFGDKIIPDYGFYYIRAIRPYWMIYAVGTRKDPNISQAVVSEMPMVVPSLEEQESIVRHLDKTIGTIDCLIAEKETLITDLEAYKKSLIFEVVTGKRKVV